MELKHLKSFLSSQKIDETHNRDSRKEYDDSSDFEDAHDKITALLKQVKMLVDSQQHENWMIDTDEQFEAETHDIWGDLSEAVNNAVKLNDALYAEMLRASGVQ
jgi:hypothetical protein